MTEIMEAAKFIRKEVSRADMYAYEAVKHQEQYPDLAQHYYKAAKEHLAIADDLHAGVVRMIENVKRSGVQPPDLMLRMWNYEHEMQIEEKDAVLRKLSMFRV